MIQKFEKPFDRYLIPLKEMTLYIHIYIKKWIYIYIMCIYIYVSGWTEDLDSRMECFTNGLRGKRSKSPTSPTSTRVMGDVMHISSDAKKTWNTPLSVN